MTTKRNPVGSVSTGDSDSIRRSIACTHGPQARKRSATAWSVMASYSAVKVPATSRKDLSKPQYKKTTRKSCSGVLTFLARTKALNSRAICVVSGGRSCTSSSKSVSGSVRGNGMVGFSCGREGHMFPLCRMPSWPTIYSLSWRKCPLPPPGWEWVVAGSGLPVLHAPPGGDPHADEEAPRCGADPGATPGQPGAPPAAAAERACQQQCQALSHCERPDPLVEGGRPRSRDGALLCPAQFPGAPAPLAAHDLIGINSAVLVRVMLQICT